MNCPFLVTPLAGGRYRHSCPACNRRLVTKSPRLHARCRVHKPDAQAKEGIPGEIRLRSDEEQAALEVICRGCEHFDAAEQWCRKCGCASSHHEAWRSKLRIGKCPVGKWPVAEVISD